MKAVSAVGGIIQPERSAAPSRVKRPAGSTPAQQESKLGSPSQSFACGKLGGLQQATKRRPVDLTLFCTLAQLQASTEQQKQDADDEALLLAIGRSVNETLASPPTFTVGSPAKIPRKNIPTNVNRLDPIGCASHKPSALSQPGDYSARSGKILNERPEERRSGAEPRSSIGGSERPRLTADSITNPRSGRTNGDVEAAPLLARPSIRDSSAGNGLRSSTLDKQSLRISLDKHAAASSARKDDRSFKDDDRSSELLIQGVSAQNDDLNVVQLAASKTSEALMQHNDNLLDRMSASSIEKQRTQKEHTELSKRRRGLKNLEVEEHVENILAARKSVFEAKRKRQELEQKHRIERKRLAAKKIDRADVNRERATVSLAVEPSKKPLRK